MFHAGRQPGFQHIRKVAACFASRLFEVTLISEALVIVSDKKCVHPEF